MSEIVWKTYSRSHDDFGNSIPTEVWCEGWGIKGLPGIFCDYAGAIAANLGLWEEYCEFHSNNASRKRSRSSI